MMKYGFFACMLLGSFWIWAQDTDTTKNELEKVGKNFREGRINLMLPIENQIPSLDKLIDIGIENHPRIKFEEKNYASTQSQIEFSRREWANNVVGTVNFFEGANNQQVTTFNDINASNSLVNGFRYGVTVNVPLYLFYGRKKRIEIFENASEAQYHKINEVGLEVSREIVRVYSEMIHFQKLMFIDAEALEVSKVNFENAEQELSRGVTDLDEYSRIQQFMRRSQADFEFARAQFYSQYKQFEILIGAKLKDLVLQ